MANATQTSFRPDQAAPPRRAVLVFARSLARDLGRRRWSRGWKDLLDVGRVIRTAAATGVDVHWFTDAPAHLRTGGAIVHRQHGQSFGERLRNAVTELGRHGYEQVTIVGRDCLQLSVADLQTAFAAMDAGRRLVLGPDHHGGCWLIGLRPRDVDLLEGVRWQQNRDFDDLRDRGQAGGVETLPVKIDLDTAADAELLCRCDAGWRSLLRPLLRPDRPGVTMWLRPVSLRGTCDRWQRPPPLAA